ncbi:hypothetical protein [Lentzea californiensis]|uniref:hypothetical protein n=1 Tax=Lentzea californiensis TaxID=438851 RepID=UPI002165EA64|nr:hypothetical protein [Lentzea californiensis]
MLRRIDAPQPEPAMPAAYPDDGTGLDRVVLYDDPDDVYRTPTTRGLLDGQRPRRPRFTV